jgi:hypothetical protein
VKACAAVHPVMMTEWGFSMSMGESWLLNGTVTNYGQPLVDFMEQYGVGYTAWCASSTWGPPMFWDDWTLRCGDGEMGCFVKDELYLSRNNDLPFESSMDFADFADFSSEWDRADCNYLNMFCGGADVDSDGQVNVADMKLWTDAWLIGY